MSVATTDSTETRSDAVATADSLPLDAVQPDMVVCPLVNLESGEPPLESALHLQQLLLLLKCLDWLWKDRTDYFAAGNFSTDTGGNCRSGASAQ
jgi:hypothetical protein